jgi:tellurite resistance protein
MKTRRGMMFLNRLNQQEKEIFLKLAIVVIRADGKIEENEKTFIAGYAHEMNISSYDLTIEFNAKPLCKSIRENSSYAVKHIFLVELTACAYADGNFGKEEKDLINLMTVDLGLTEHDLSECIKLLKNYTSAVNALTNFVQEGK